MSDDSPQSEEADVNRNISCGDVPVDKAEPLLSSSCSGIGSFSRDLPGHVF